MVFGPRRFRAVRTAVEILAAVRDSSPRSLEFTHLDELRATGYRFETHGLQSGKKAAQILEQLDR